MTTAWIFPGGGTFGAIQVGLVTALTDADIAPDMVLGTSVGSLNATWMAGDPTRRGAASLRQVWLSMRRRDVFPIQPVRILRARLGLANHVMNNTALLRWLRGAVPFSRLEDGRVPLTVTATDSVGGEPVYLDRGRLLPALLASCALPGVFPPVRWGQRWLIDGGMAADAPVSRAVAQGADRVYVLSCGGTEPFTPTTRKRNFRDAAVPAAPSPPRTTLAMTGLAMNAAISAATRLELELNADRCELYVLPAPSIAGLSLYSFGQSAALMAAAERVAREWLRDARPIASGPVTADGSPWK